MLHRGKAHTYDLQGPYGIACGASVVWFAGSLFIGSSMLMAPEFVGLILPAFTLGVSVSWLLGLIAFAHRRTAWKLWACESIVLLGLIGFWLAQPGMLVE